MAERRLKLVVQLQSGKAEAGLKRLGGSMGGLTKAAGALGVAFGAVGLVGLAKNLVATAARFQDLRVQLETVEGSARAAEKAFDGLKDFAAKTPFQLDNLTRAWVQFRAVGLDPSMEDLRSAGDLAAAFGTDITQAVNAVTRAAFGEAESLKQYGIIMRTEGESVRITFKGVTQEVERDAQSITDALLDISKSNFADAMGRKAVTLSGRISTLKDAWANFADELLHGGGIEALSDVVLWFTKIIEKATSLVKQWDDVRGGAALMAAGVVRSVGGMFESFNRNVALLSAKFGILLNEAPGLAKLLVPGLKATSDNAFILAEAFDRTADDIKRLTDSEAGAFEQMAEDIIDAQIAAKRAGDELATAIPAGAEKAIAAVKRLSSHFNSDLFVPPDRIGDLWFPPGTVDEIVKRAKEGHAKAARELAAQSHFMPPDAIGMLWFPPGTMDEIKRNLQEAQGEIGGDGTEDFVSVFERGVSVLSEMNDGASQFAAGAAQMVQAVIALAAALKAAESASVWLAALGLVLSAFNLFGGGGGGGGKSFAERMTDLAGSIEDMLADVAPLTGQVKDVFAEIREIAIEAYHLGTSAEAAFAAAQQKIVDLRNEILGIDVEGFGDRLRAALELNIGLGLAERNGGVGGGLGVGGGFTPDASGGAIAALAPSIDGAAQAATQFNSVLGEQSERYEVAGISLVDFASQLVDEFRGIDFEFMSVQASAESLRDAIVAMGFDAATTARLLDDLALAEEQRMVELESGVLNELFRIWERSGIMQAELSQERARLEQVQTQIALERIKIEAQALGLMTQTLEAALNALTEWAGNIENFNVRIPNIRIRGIGGGRGRGRSGPSRADRREDLLEELSRFLDSGRARSLNAQMRELRETFFGPGGFLERARELGVPIQRVTEAFAAAARELRETAFAGIRDVLRDLRLGTGGFGGASLSQQFFSQQSEFNRLASLARGGDLDAAQQLGDFSRTYIETIRSMFGGSRRGQALIDQVQQSLEGIVGVGATAGERLDTERNTVLYDIRELLGGEGRPFDNMGTMIRDAVLTAADEQIERLDRIAGFSGETSDTLKRQQKHRELSAYRAAREASPVSFLVKHRAVGGGR